MPSLAYHKLASIYSKNCKVFNKALSQPGQHTRTEAFNRYRTFGSVPGGSVVVVVVIVRLLL